MQVNIKFAYNENCYIIVSPDSIVVTPKVHKATVQKIYYNIIPAKVYPETDCVEHSTFVCMYKDGMGSEHTASVKEDYMFRTRQQAVDEAKRIVTERFEKAMEQLEEV